MKNRWGKDGETSSSKSWNVGGPLGQAGLESWDEEEESRKVEQILGSEMMPAQQDCCDSSEIAEEQRLRQNMV